MKLNNNHQKRMRIKILDLQIYIWEMQN